MRNYLSFALTVVNAGIGMRSVVMVFMMRQNLSGVTLF